MRSYSVDLRERIIEARQSGHNQHWIAETFRVSVSTVKRYLVRYQVSGNVAPTVQRRLAPRISAKYEPVLRALVAEWPDAKLEQYCAAWVERTGMVVSVKTMSRMLVRLG